MKRKIVGNEDDRKRLKISELPQSVQDQIDQALLNDEGEDDIELLINDEELQTNSEFQKLFYRVGNENPNGTTTQEIERLEDDEAKIKEVANLINRDVGVEVPTEMDIDEDDDNDVDMSVEYVNDIDWFVPDWKKRIKIDDKSTMRSDGIIFQEIKTEYVTKKSKKFSFDYPGPKGVKVPVVQMYGITENRKSVLCNIWGFQPYFYIWIPQTCRLTPKQIIQKIEHENKIRIVKKILDKRMVDTYKIILSERYESNNSARYSVRLISGKIFDIVDNETGMFDDDDDTKEIQTIKRKINYAFQNVKCVHEYHFEEKTSVWHHQHDVKKSFLKIITYIPSNVSAIREIIDPKESSDVISYRGQPFKFQTYESNVVFTLRCMANKEIKPATWIEAYNSERSSIKESHCDIEINVSCNDIVGHEPKGKFDKIAPYCILSFDIECYGNVYEKNKKKKIVRFPKADIKKCKVTQIANTITIGKNTVIKNCFTLGTCAKIDKDIGDVYCFRSERQLLMAWRKFVLTIDPDVITGYNIIAFDLPYLFNRAKYLVLPDFPLLGRIKKKACYHRVQEKGSKQTGKRLTTDITMYGRNVIDVMNFTILFKYPKLASYTLNYVAYCYLGDQKEDVHYSMIPTLQDTSKNTRKRLVMYCIKDALLPQQIMDKQTLIERITEISRVTGVQLEWVIERGQVIRVFSQLLRYANKLDYIIPVFRIQGYLDKFKGAIVKNPMKVFHKNPISTLDFASLYPSIMIAKNLCYTTYIPSHRWHMYTRDQYVITPVGHRFVKTSVKMGFLAEILKGLLSARSKAKKEMYNATDPFRIAVLNGRQLALKISANSVYGFTGANYGMLPLRAISESVTAYGRMMIEDTTTWVEQKFRKGAVLHWPDDLTYRDGSHEIGKKLFEGGHVMKHNTMVIYGDSVTGDTPVILRNSVTKAIFIRQIQDIIKMDSSFTWTDFHTLTNNDQKKEQILTNRLEVWSSCGWLPVKRVIRHKTKKEIYRVNTHCGSVDVTKDHSLLTNTQKQIKPCDCVVGKTKLLHSLPSRNIIINKYSTNLTAKKDIAWCYGLFFADGSAGISQNKATDGNWWKISKKNKNLLEIAKEKLNKNFPEFEFYIVDHLKSSKVYNLLCKRRSNIYGIKVKFIEIWRKMFYDRKLKKVPDTIINETNKIILESFLKGYYSGDGDKVDPGTRFSCKGKIGSMGLYFVCYMLGYNVSINTRLDKMEMYRITFSKNKFRKDPNLIKKIYELGRLNNEFVYDIETIVDTKIKLKNSNISQFQAGVGAIIVKNTDSVMIDFGPYDRKIAWFLAHLAEYYVAKELFISDIIKLCFEKIFHPYLLMSKKNYAGLHFEGKHKWKKPKYLNTKGIEVVRRDKPAFVREALKKTLDLIFEPFSVYPVRDITEGVQNGYNYLCQVMSDILERKLPFDKYIITKRISKKIRHGTEEALCHLINKMIEGSKRYDEEIVREEIAKITMDDVTLKKNKSHWRYILTLAEQQEVAQIRKYLKKIMKNCKNDFELGGYYKTKTTHSELTKKIKKRDPGSEAKLGDRIKFVYVAKGKKAKAYEMGEDPIFALKNDIPIDVNYYLVKKFIPVILNRFSPIFTVNQLYSIFGSYMKIHSKMNKQERKRIQIPLHPIRITIRKNKRAFKIVQAPVQTLLKQSIGFYFKKKEKCVNCKKHMVKSNGLCVNCLPGKVQIHEQFSKELSIIKEEIDLIEKTCRECQGEDLEQVPCSNDDCPLFYQKYQVGKNLDLCEKKLETLDW